MIFGTRVAMKACIKRESPRATEYFKRKKEAEEEEEEEEICL
jgi:hypothetical protein